VHLLAIAGRLGIDLKLDEFDRISRRTPSIVNLKPSGEYLMEDFFEAGGVPAVMNEILDLLHADAVTANGRTIRENVSGAQCWNRNVIRGVSEPLSAEGGTVVLRGNLAPRGAILKQSAASPHLLRHRGPAYVFENHADMLEQIESPDLPVTRDTVLVMKSCGPHGAPGFPEWGQIPMPRVLLDQGVNDAVRISDARMSGTSFGTVVLHVAPESAVGGPLAAVETGDEVELDTAGRTLTLHVSSEEIARRLAARPAAAPHYDRGYGWMFLQHVNQADEGCDFDFLRKR
jgi:L-arabonate dehydrase